MMLEPVREHIRRALAAPVQMHWGYRVPLSNAAEVRPVPLMKGCRWYEYRC